MSSFNKSFLYMLIFTIIGSVLTYSLVVNGYSVYYDVGYNSTPVSFSP